MKLTSVYLYSLLSQQYYYELLLPNRMLCRLASLPIWAINCFVIVSLFKLRNSNALTKLQQEYYYLLYSNPRSIFPDCIYDDGFRANIQATVPELSDKYRNKHKAAVDSCSISCPSKVEWVCANDGNSYSNLCNLCKIACERNIDRGPPVILYKKCDGRCPCKDTEMEAEILAVQKKINELEAYLKQIEDRRKVLSRQKDEIDAVIEVYYKEKTDNDNFEL
ncbi:uncharacterized protein [Amphiura filiformis]|uniref:uncharacterized protein isoform X1 n=1 Tax=Amphiura filiformis TaxID=82378 RepID=UPI003B217DDF